MCVCVRVRTCVCVCVCPLWSTMWWYGASGKTQNPGIPCIWAEYVHIFMSLQRAVVLAELVFAEPINGQQQHFRLPDTSGDYRS